MKYIKENVNIIILCIFELVVGILLMVNPVGFTSWIIRVAGVVMMMMGIREAVRYFRTDAAEAATGQNLMKGLFFILTGGFCTFRTDWFIATFPVLTIIYGVTTLIAGIGKIQLTVDMFRQKNRKWTWAALNAAVSLICAVIILSSPFTSTAVLWMFTGASLLAEGVLDTATLITGRKA